MKLKPRSGKRSRKCNRFLSVFYENINGLVNGRAPVTGPFLLVRLRAPIAWVEYIVAVVGGRECTSEHKKRRERDEMKKMRAWMKKANANAAH